MPALESREASEGTETEKSERSKMGMYNLEWVGPTLEDLAAFCEENGFQASHEAILMALTVYKAEAKTDSKNVGKAQALKLGTPKRAPANSTARPCQC